MPYQSGDTIGELTYIKRSHVRDTKHCYSIFKCQCGTEFSARNDSVKIGRIKSCGCKSNEMRRIASTKHEMVEYVGNGVKKMPRFREEDISRFWEKVNCDSNAHHCWDWTTTNNGRYGYFNMGQSGYFKANRVSFFLHNKIDPGEQNVLHTCDNPLCCNPHHLFLGDHQENMQDMVRKGRNVSGSQINSAKLTDDQVRELRRLYKEGLNKNQLASKFGISAGSAHAAANGLRYKKVL